jgi:hypothetical protein
MDRVDHVDHGSISRENDRLAAHPLDRATFTRAGSFHLKGLDEPEEVWVESEDLELRPRE